MIYEKHIFWTGKGKMIEMAFCILWKIRDYVARIQNAVHLLGA